MSQMDVPTKADITRRIKEIEKAAKEELEGLKARAQEAMQNPQAQEVDPAQAQQAFQQGQQQILANYAPMLKEAESQVRSEEHTSELQSLMRNSDAVYCLTKKTTKDT